MTEDLASYIYKNGKAHLIFNFDGTLAYLDAPWAEAAELIRDELRELDEELWARHGYKVSAQFQNELVRKHGKKGLDILLQHLPLFEMQYAQNVTHNKALAKQIQDFRGEYSMYIWSSNSRQLIETVLEAAGMQGWFDKIVTRNDVRYLKPNPEGFMHIYDMRVPESEYVLIGDSATDRAAAAAAEIDFYHLDFFNLGR